MKSRKWILAIARVWSDCCEALQFVYNTYWVRFSHGRATFEEAVANSRALIQAAREAGVRRIVHLSIANPSVDSQLPYYSGKARVEKAILDSGLSYAILRPTVIFGVEDILINNIAWFARRFPCSQFPAPADTSSSPFLSKTSQSWQSSSAREENNLVLDAVGQEIFTFEDLVQQIAVAVNAKPKFIHVSPWVALQMLRLVGPVIGDVVLTREEIEGLMANLLASKQPATGQTRFSAWLAKNSAVLGRRIDRNFRDITFDPTQTVSSATGLRISSTENSSSASQWLQALGTHDDKRLFQPKK